MPVPGSTDHVSFAVNAFSWRQAEALAKELSIPLVVAAVMMSRGVSDAAEAREFLSCTARLPDPFLFAGMQGAVDAISSAIEQGRKIVVHGDYDADGITATALLQSVLDDLGAHVDWYLPSRFEEGYGLSYRAVEAVVAQGAAILLTVDCGVNYPDEVAFAKGLGLEVIVVDHHQPGPRLPECHLVHHIHGDYPHGDLCGVGLALKLAHALHVRRAGAGRHALPEGLASTLDLVALGTIADLASLRGENRYYVSEGLKSINVGERVGLRALAEVSGCAGNVDSGTVAFRLAPRLNAAGRLADPSPPLRLLLTRDADEAVAIAAELHELNGARQDLERQMFDEALGLVTSMPSLPEILVLAGDQWHEGVVGIVASRLVERYQRPAILLSVRDGIAKGSGRSIPAYDLFEALTSCRDLLTVYGGHAQAAGLTLDAGRVGALGEALRRHAESVLRPEDLIPVCRVDGVATSAELNPDTALAIAALEPFGTGNPRPRLLVVDATLEGATPTRNGLHLRSHLRSGGVRIPAVGFGMGKREDLMDPQPRTRSMGGQLRVDEWQGTLRTQFIVECVGEAVRAGSDGAGCGPKCPMDVSGVFGASSVPVGDSEPQPDGSTTAQWPAGSRDLRDKPGRWTEIAQILAAQERSVLLTGSAPALLGELRSRLPLDAFSREGFACVSRYCCVESGQRLTRSTVLVAEWEAVAFSSDAVAGREHAIVVDPPFRRAHLELVSKMAADGATVHLLHGKEQKAAAMRLLRYQVHPRFAMVCLYRAMQGAETDVEALFAQASALAWAEAKVVLTTDDLERARDILSALRLGQNPAERARLDARESAAYKQAEADYEECAALCLTL